MADKTASIFCVNFCSHHILDCLPLSHAATWALWIAFLSMWSFAAHLDLCLPSQPSLSFTAAYIFIWSSEIQNYLNFVPVYHRSCSVRIHHSGRLTYFVTPHGWCGNTPYNRAGGCGYLNALIFTAEEGGWEGFNSVESGSSTFVPTIQWLHPLHIPHEVTPEREFMDAEPLLKRVAPLIAEDLAPLWTKIEQPT